RDKKWPLFLAFLQAYAPIVDAFVAMPMIRKYRLASKLFEQPAARRCFYSPVLSRTGGRSPRSFCPILERMRAVASCENRRRYRIRLTLMSPAAPTRSDRRFQIDALDGVRGLAVLLVFFSHCSNKGVSLISNWDFSGIGKSGVWLFFLLSSFLLTYPFIAKGKQAFATASLGQYFWRRALRVYPLYTLY